MRPKRSALADTLQGFINQAPGMELLHLDFYLPHQHSGRARPFQKHLDIIELAIDHSERGAWQEGALPLFLQ